MIVPLLDLNAQNDPLAPELKAAFERVLSSGRFILGPEVKELEAKIAEMTDAKYAIGVSSGTDAILLALMALDIGPGDEVLCPSFTFFATAGCIARTGAKPVFIDVQPDTFNLDIRDAERKVTEATKAIIPVHLFGQAVEMDSVADFADQNGLAVIEDAAQALGAKYKGRPVGGLGTFGTFSFFPSKNLGGFGDGGMLVTNDEKLSEKAVTLRAHGSNPKYYHRLIGGNFRLDPLQAALLLVKLPHYEEYTRLRQRNAERYARELVKLASSKTGSGTSERERTQWPLIPPVNVQGDGHIWNQYTLRLTEPGRRDRLRKDLNANEIGSEIYYPVPMDAQDCFAHLNQEGTCPVSTQLANEVLSIPIYPELRVDQQDAVLASLTSGLLDMESERPSGGASLAQR